MKSIFRGFGYNIKGWRYFFAHKTLWKFALIPFFLNILFFALILFLYFHFYDDVFATLFKPFSKWDIENPQGFWQNVFDVAYWFLRLLMKATIFIVSFLLILMSGYLASLIMNGPFYELLSEKVLVLHGKCEDKSFALKAFFSEIKHSFKNEVAKIVLFITVTFVLFLLSWIPILGIVATVLQFAFSAWFFAFGVCTYPPVLLRLPTSKIIKWGTSHKPLLFGFGLPSLIPFVGLLLMNFQVVGGTLLYMDNQDAT